MPQLLGSFWGALEDAGQLNDHHLLRAKPTRCTHYKSSFWSKCCQGFSQCFRLTGSVLGSPETAASQLHYSCNKPPEPTQQPPGPGKKFRPPKTQLRALRDSLLWGRKSGNPRGPRVQDKLLSARLTQPAEFRDQASLQTHLTGANRALSNSSNSLFLRKFSPLHQKNKCLLKHYFLLYFQCLKRSTGFASLHCACICTETNVGNALMLYAEATRFLPWMSPRTCYSHTSYKEVPADWFTFSTPLSSMSWKTKLKTVPGQETSDIYCKCWHRLCQSNLP